MSRKRASGPTGGLYAGLSLAEWRGSIRVLQASGWWRFAGHGARNDPPSTLHFAVVQAAALLLPLTWHKANAGRFDPGWYANRRGRVNARAAFLRDLAARAAGGGAQGCS